MLDLIIIFIAGVFVGWNVPQPFWATWAQHQISTWWTKTMKKDLTDE